MTRLRPARPTDAGAVGAILSDFAARTPWMPKLHSRAQDIAHAGQMIDRGWVTVAEEGGAITGFSALSGAEVNALYAATPGQGIGTALLYALQRASAHLTLWTFQANTGAQRFYLRHGFEITRQTDGADNDERLPDLQLDWRKEGA